MKFEGHQVNIPIKGIMRAGTDNLCADGAMNEVIGMEYKDGSWLPYMMSEGDGSFSRMSGVVKAYVHKTSDGESHYVYICQVAYEEEGVIHYRKDLYYEAGRTQTGGIIGQLLVSDIKDVEFVGNMLCVATKNGLEYYLWKDSTYEKRENEFPSVSLRTTVGFMCDGEKVDGVQHCAITGQIDDDTKRRQTIKELNYSGIFAALGGVTNLGGLTGYCLACVAIRYKNKALKVISAPVLLSRPMAVHGTYADGFREYNIANNSELFGPRGYEEQLYSQKENGSAPDGYVIYPEYEDVDTGTVSSHPDRYEEFTDGIKKIKQRTPSHTGCFVTELIELKAARKHSNPNFEIQILGLPYTPTLLSTWFNRDASKQNPTHEKMWNMSYAAGNGLQYRINSVAQNENSEISSLCIFLTPEVSPYMLKESIDDYESMMYNTTADSIVSATRDNKYYTYESHFVRRRKEDDIIDEMLKLKNFYLVKEIPISSLAASDEWVDIELQNLLGDNLVVREQLPLSAFDGTETTPSHIDSYNYRLHAYDYIQELFKGYTIGDYAHHGGSGQYPAEEWVHVYNEGTEDEYTRTYKWEIKVLIKGDDGESVVVNYDNTALESIIGTLSPIIMYPDENAESITIGLYVYDSRPPETIEIGGRTIVVEEYSETHRETFTFKHDMELGLAYYIDPELKPIIPKLLTTEPENI